MATAATTSSGSATTCLLLLTLLLTNPQPSHSLPIYFSQYRTMLSLAHSLITRVANLRASRGDYAGAARARSISQKLESGLGLGFWKFMLKMGFDYVKNYSWSDNTFSSSEMFDAVKDLNELLGSLNELTRIDSQAKRAAWVGKNYKNVLRASNSLFTRLLNFRQSGAYDYFVVAASFVVGREKRLFKVMASSSSSHDHIGSLESQETLEEAPRVRGRGKTKCLDIRLRKSKIHLECNELNPVICDEGKKMSSFLGTLARNNQLCPLYKVDWRNLNKGGYKKRLFGLFEENFSYDIPRDEMKRIVLQSIGRKWKNYKSKLRKKFDPTLSDEENFERRPSDVLRNQWEELVMHFRRTQPRSEKANEHRSMQKINHTLGRKSYAKKRKEMEDEKGGGEVSPLKFWKATHTRKDSEQLEGEAANVEAEAKRKFDEKIGGSNISTGERFTLEHEALVETLGPERSGRVRGLGLGVTPTRYYAYCRNRAENHEVNALKMKLEEMRQQMIEAEEKRLQAEKEREKKVKQMEEEMEKKLKAEDERDKKMKQMEEEVREMKQLLFSSKKLKKRAAGK